MSLRRLRRAFLDLEAGVDVLGVLPEDHHVDLLRVLHGRRHAGEPAHRAQAHVEVEELAQRDVEAADAAADRRGERALDADQVVLERLDGLVGQPVAGRVERLLAREHLFPLDRLAELRRGGVQHQLGGRPDVDAGAVTLDEGDDRLVGDVELTVGQRDLLGHQPAPRYWTKPDHRTGARGTRVSRARTRRAEDDQVDRRERDSPTQSVRRGTGPGVRRRRPASSRTTHIASPRASTAAPQSGQTDSLGVGR